MNDYPLYSDKQSDIFETKMNKEFRCIHGYKNHFENNVFITWVSIKSWEILLSEFPQAIDINPCPRKIICNNCELINVSGDILNADENVEDKYGYVFTGSLKKNPYYYR